MTGAILDTRSKLVRAGGELFAAQGPSGTTVDEIARVAGVNRERVYAYFGGKAGLFAAVLAESLTDIAAAVPLDASTVTDIGGFAGRLFDYHAAHPRLQRLLQWEALTIGSGPVPDEAMRRTHYGHKVDVIAQAQRAGALDDEIPAAHLLLLLIAITAWWSAVPQLVRMLEEPEPDESALRRRRASAMIAAERLACARPG